MEDSSLEQNAQPKIDAESSPWTAASNQLAPNLENEGQIEDSNIKISDENLNQTVENIGQNKNENVEFDENQNLKDLVSFQKISKASSLECGKCFINNMLNFI